jgi:3-oxoacyl-[acyl-carrier protein] reductase
VLQHGICQKPKKAVEEQGVKFVAIQADFSSLDVIENIVDTALIEFGKIDILVNNAGII